MEDDLDFLQFSQQELGHQSVPVSKESNKAINEDDDDREVEVEASSEEEGEDSDYQTDTAEEGEEEEGERELSVKVIRREINEHVNEAKNEPSIDIPDKEETWIIKNDQDDQDQGQDQDLGLRLKDANLSEMDMGSRTNEEDLREEVDHDEESDDGHLSVSLDFKEILGISNSSIVNNKNEDDQNGNEKKGMENEEKHLLEKEVHVDSIHHEGENLSPLNFSVINESNNKEAYNAKNHEENENDKTFAELEKHFPSNEFHIKEVQGIAPKGHVYTWINENLSSKTGLLEKDSNLDSGFHNTSQSQSEVTERRPNNNCIENKQRKDEVQAHFWNIGVGLIIGGSSGQLLLLR